MTGMPRGVTQSTGYPESATFLADMVNQSYMTDVNGRGQNGCGYLYGSGVFEHLLEAFKDLSNNVTAGIKQNLIRYSVLELFLGEERERERGLCIILKFLTCI